MNKVRDAEAQQNPAAVAGESFAGAEGVESPKTIELFDVALEVVVQASTKMEIFFVKLMDLAVDKYFRQKFDGKFEVVSG